MKEILLSHPTAAAHKATDQERLEHYFDRLWPLCRSITGPGLRESLDILSEIMPLERLSFRSGEKVLDWTVPEEWLVREAYLTDPQGNKRAEFKKNNLHLMNYSIPFRGTLSLAMLKPHLYSLPSQPNAIPYVTSYYQKRWGFCLSHDELTFLPEGNYQVVVDTELKPGALEMGEAVLPGDTQDEIFFTSYLCHPSMANNELSGPLVMSFLYERLRAKSKRRFTYRFILGPETIGALCYLSRRGALLKERMQAGFIMTCLGDRGHFTYKLSRRGNALGDRAADLVLRSRGEYLSIPFDPLGSDERQYCSPGFNLPVGSLMRTPYGTYPEYHTSLDDKNFISFDSLAQSIQLYEEVIDAMEANLVYTGTVQYGEPQLGSRGLYSTLGSHLENNQRRYALLWLLNLADGTRDLLSIAEQSGQPISLLLEWANILVKEKLLEAVKK